MRGSFELTISNPFHTLLSDQQLRMSMSSGGLAREVNRRLLAQPLLVLFTLLYPNYAEVRFFMQEKLINQFRALFEQTRAKKIHDARKAGNMQKHVVIVQTKENYIKDIAWIECWKHWTLRENYQEMLEREIREEEMATDIEPYAALAAIRPSSEGGGIQPVPQPEHSMAGMDDEVEDGADSVYNFYDDSYESTHVQLRYPRKVHTKSRLSEEVE